MTQPEEPAPALADFVGRHDELLQERGASSRATAWLTDAIHVWVKDGTQSAGGEER